jgi:drug/metabolite transporter (DMT)-like permease
MGWFTFSLISIFFLATAELTQQHLLNKAKAISERSSASLTFFIISFLTLPIILLTELKYGLFDVFSPDILPKLIGATVLGSIGMVYYLRSFKVKNISISTIFISLSVVVSTTLGIIFFKEGLYFEKILGILLILIAIVSLNIKNISLEKNHLYALLGGFIFGATYTLDKSVVIEVHPVIYIFWSFMFASFALFFQKPKELIATVKRSNLNTYKPVVFSGIGYLVYNFATFTSYSIGGEVGRVDAINNSQIFLIILFEYFILKQKENTVRKLVTAAIAFSGVMILGYL